MANIRKKFKGTALSLGPHTSVRYQFILSRRKFGRLPEEKVCPSLYALCTHTQSLSWQICREDHIHLHIRLQSGRWAHGGSQLDFKSKVQ